VVNFSSQNFNGVNGFNRAEKGIPYTKNIEKQGLMGYCTEVTEDNTEVNFAEETSERGVFPYKTEVTEQTEVKPERCVEIKIWLKQRKRGFKKIVVNCRNGDKSTGFMNELPRHIS